MNTTSPVFARSPRVWLAALAAVTVLRLAVAAASPLSPDEAYYWIWSHALSAGYADHPPMVAVWIRLGTALAGENTLGVRLLAPFAAALGSLLLADAADLLFPGRRAGLAAAALLNATLLLGVGAVTMTPDTPLILFWTASVWALVRFQSAERGSWLVLAGAFGGFALASKYTAAFLAPAVLLWLLLVPSLRRWLTTPWPWLAALVAAAIFAPVVWWNEAHGWVSFVRQGGRVDDWQPDRAIRFLGELIGGQIGFATPLVFVLMAAGVGASVLGAWRSRDPGFTLVACLTLPPLAVFLQHALGDRVQGNWPSILYPGAALAAGGMAGRLRDRVLLPALALGAAVVLVVYAQAVFRPLPLSPRDDPTTLRLAGWPALADQVTSLAASQHAAFVAADDYAVAAELAWTLPGGIPVVGADPPRWRAFALPPGPPEGETGLLVRPARRTDPPDKTLWSSVTPAGAAAREDRGEIEAFDVYRVVLRHDAPQLVTLPSRTVNVLH